MLGAAVGHGPAVSDAMDRVSIGPRWTGSGGPTKGGGICLGGGSWPYTWPGRVSCTVGAGVGTGLRAARRELALGAEARGFPEKPTTFGYAVWRLALKGMGWALLG